MRAEEAYGWLMQQSRETAYLSSFGNVLHWDRRTCMPPAGIAHRASQLDFLARLVHERKTDPQWEEMLAAVEGSSLVRDALSVESVNVREWRRTYDRAVRIPASLAAEMARAGAESEEVWRRARPENDWKSFEPHLERMVALKRQEADALGFASERYDALLDDFEPGETAGRLQPVFASLRGGLTGLLDRIRGGTRRPDIAVLRGRFPVEAQEAFALETVRRLGYRLDGGRMDVSAHPFTVGIGPGDVRITTRFDETALGMGFFGAVHEAGHALYDQGLPAEHWGSPMGRSASLGIHESQSRLWENLVARSLSFWKHFYPLVRERFPALLHVDLDTFYFAVNAVSPSLIRTEADEVTYNLHIMVRFELELELLRGTLEARDLPNAWDARMEAYLGLRPQDVSSGVMQDIHWSGGAMGYFPTYTLGNLYAAQFMAAAAKDLGDLDAIFSNGDFAPFLQWLRNKVHIQGRRYRPRDLLRMVTGEDLNPDHLTSYLEGKMAPLYGLQS